MRITKAILTIILAIIATGELTDGNLWWLQLLAAGALVVLLFFFTRDARKEYWA
jgi:hypothetical protein